MNFVHFRFEWLTSVGDSSTTLPCAISDFGEIPARLSATCILSKSGPGGNYAPFASPTQRAAFAAAGQIQIALGQTAFGLGEFASGAMTPTVHFEICVSGDSTATVVRTTR
jgi:hypothetical protein